MTGRLRQVALTSEEVERILVVCGRQALLVGGQALAFWALYFGVQPVGVLAAAVTTDVDFIGNRTVAGALHKALGRPWQLREAALDDSGSQTAKVYARVPGEGLKQVDFLSGIVGLETDKVRKRAVEAQTSHGITFRVLHPLDVLESRLRNLDSLPDKRNETGVAQARLALEVVRAFIESQLESGNAPRVALQAVRRVGALALDGRLANLAFACDLDILGAVPAEQILMPRFRQRYWPEVHKKLERKRHKYRMLEARRRALKVSARAKTAKPGARSRR